MFVKGKPNRRVQRWGEVHATCGKLVFFPTNDVPEGPQYLSGAIDLSSGQQIDAKGYDRIACSKKDDVTVGFKNANGGELYLDNQGKSEMIADAVQDFDVSSSGNYVAFALWREKQICAFDVLKKQRSCLSDTDARGPVVVADDGHVRYMEATSTGCYVHPKTGVTSLTSRPGFQVCHGPVWMQFDWLIGSGNDTLASVSEDLSQTIDIEAATDLAKWWHVPAH